MSRDGPVCGRGGGVQKALRGVLEFADRDVNAPRDVAVVEVVKRVNPGFGGVTCKDRIFIQLG